MSDGNANGVESPKSSDMAAVGDTRNPLHYKPLPRLVGPNYGSGGKVAGSEKRDDSGHGASN